MDEEEYNNLEHNIHKDVAEDAKNGDGLASTKMVAIQIAIFHKTLKEEGITDEDLIYELTFMFASQIMGVESNGIPF